MLFKGVEPWPWTVLRRPTNKDSRLELGTSFTGSMRTNSSRYGFGEGRNWEGEDRWVGNDASSGVRGAGAALSSQAVS